MIHPVFIALVLSSLAVASDVARSVTTAAERRLAAAKPKIMSADYRADVAALERLRDEVLRLRDDPAAGYLALHWAGFASWRIAINGNNAGLTTEQIESSLHRAVTDLEESVRLRGDFADSHAALASIQGWLIVFAGKDGDLATERITMATKHLARAKELEPDNPRVLWVQGGDLWFRPPQFGGDRKKAVEIYRRALEFSPEKSDARSPLPDWGRPEALMALAFAHLNQTPPDLAAADEEARAALRLQPQWKYVRDTLLPMIEKASSTAGK